MNTGRGRSRTHVLLYGLEKTAMATMAMGENQNERKPPAETTLHPDARGTHLEIPPRRVHRGTNFPRSRRAAPPPGMPDRRNPGTRYTISLLGSTSIIACSRDKHQDRRFHTVRERVSAERSAVPQRDVIALRSIGTTR